MDGADILLDAGLELAAIVLVNFVSVWGARWLALRKGRAPTAWMWLAAFLGPLILLPLALLPSAPKARITA